MLTCLTEAGEVTSTLFFRCDALEQQQQLLNEANVSNCYQNPSTEPDKRAEKNSSTPAGDKFDSDEDDNCSTSETDEDCRVVETNNIPDTDEDDNCSTSETDRDCRVVETNNGSEISDTDEDNKLSTSETESDYENNFSKGIMSGKSQTPKSVWNQLTYSCKKCGKVFANRFRLLYHDERIHKNIHRFVCHVCGKRFYRNYELRNHVSCVHDKILRFACEICGRRFALKKTRDDHMTIHTGERPLICDVCGKSFATSTILYCHKRSHQNFVGSCTICGKEYRSRVHLRGHMYNHTRPELVSCDICDKSFTTRPNMLEHRRNVHSDKRPHVCSVCGKAYKKRKSLMKHGNSHRKGDSN